MSIRLFLGIAPEDLQRQKLHDLQRDLADLGREVRPANLHMTLFFLGTVEEASAADFVRAIDSQVWPKFEVTLDQLTLWHKPKILCLAGTADDPQLQSVVASIRAIAAAVGLAKPHHSFTPHITLMRKARFLPEAAAQLLSAPLLLKPDAMHLYQSISHDSGVEYTIIKSWSLQTAS